MSTTAIHTADNTDWLLDEFAHRVDGVVHAVTVSADGLCIARSRELGVDEADRLAAMTSGLVSLTQAAAKQFGAEPVVQSMIEMSGLHLCLMSISDGSHLVVLATADADLGAVAFGMVQLVDRVGRVAFDPDIRPDLS